MMYKFLILDIDCVLCHHWAMLIETADGTADFDARVLDLPGTLPVILPICRKLKIAQIIDRLCPMKRGDHLTHGQVAEFVVLHILQAEHRLPLYRLEQWADRHGMHALYDHEPERFNDDRVRRTLDAIASCIPDIEACVVSQALHSYRIDASSLHWDMTHVSFTGAHTDSDIICRGYGAGQVHEKQVQVSLHVTTDGGIPVRHETLPGSTNQRPLAPRMLRDLKDRLPTDNLIIVSDRAGICYENIVDYRRANAHFLGPLQIINPEHRQQLADVEQEDFQPLQYRSINKPNDAYECYPTQIRMNRRKGSDPVEVDALFIHSHRLHRDQADTRERHIQSDLRRLAEIDSYLNKNCYTKAEYATKQLQKAVREELKPIVRYELSGTDRALSLRYWVDEAARAEAGHDDGRFILVYDLPDNPTPDQVFELHRRQGVIEQRNRNLNSDLTVHPVWLQDDRRIEALLLLFVLALIVYTILELCSVRAKLDTEYYHKMTAREMFWIFGRTRLKQLLVDGKVKQQELLLTTEQTMILQQLGFPDPISYLQ